jgi:hypothetical protein
MHSKGEGDHHILSSNTLFSMKNYFLYIIAALVLSAFGCEKNQDITQIDIIEPEPGERNSRPLNGHILDASFEPIEQAEVVIYQDGLVYTSTLTDEAGFYEFPIGTFPVENILVAARKAQYFENYKRVDKSSEEPVNITLAPEGYQGLQSSALNPSDSLVLLSGKAINEANGTGESGVYVLLYDDIQFLGSAISDDNGDFSLLTQKNKAFELIAKSPCQQGSFGPIEFSPLQNDTTLAPFIDDFVEGLIVSFSGTAVDCDGNPLNGGTVEFRYLPGILNQVEYPLGNDGTFSFPFNSCGIDDTNPVSIVVYDVADENFGSVSFLYEGSAQVEVGEISVCNPNGQFFTFSSPDTTFQLEEEWSVLELLGKRAIGYSSDNGNCQLIFTYSEDTGSFPMESFYYADFNDNYYSIQSNGTVEVTEVSPTRIVGTFSGVGSTNEQSDVPIQGSFDILFE